MFSSNVNLPVTSSRSFVFSSASLIFTESLDPARLIASARKYPVSYPKALKASGDLSSYFSLKAFTKF